MLNFGTQCRRGIKKIFLKYLPWFYTLQQFFPLLHVKKLCCYKPDSKHINFSVKQLTEAPYSTPQYYRKYYNF